jgi:hypothetical protein
MKNKKSNSSALSNFKVDSNIESKDSQVYNASIPGASDNINDHADIIAEPNPDKQYEYPYSIWDYYVDKIKSRSKYLSKFTEFDLIIGQAINGFIELLAEDPRCKLIDVRALALDDSSSLNSKRNEKLYNLNEVSKYTGLSVRKLRKGLQEGYFFGNKVNGKWEITSMDLEFIRCFAYIARQK